MLTLRESDILLGCRAEDWRSALDLAAESLAGAGLTEPAYREGLLSREMQSSTYLGNAIAIPHARPRVVPMCCAPASGCCSSLRGLNGMTVSGCMCW